VAKQVQCPTHGVTAGCVICRHLRDGSDLGYYRIEVPPGVDFYETGLCEACDALLWEEDGWTDRLFDFADWKLFCRECFEGTLKRHRLLGVGQHTSEEEA
jgi:hypothetical protein